MNRGDIDNLIGFFTCLALVIGCITAGISSSFYDIDKPARSFKTAGWIAVALLVIVSGAFLGLQTVAYGISPATRIELPAWTHIAAGIVYGVTVAALVVMLVWLMATCEIDPE